MPRYFHVIKTGLLLSLFLTTYQGQGQIIKNLGIKGGITNSYMTWKFKANSTAPNSEHIESNKAIGTAFLLSGDFLDKKYWGVGLSTGWVTRNATMTYNPGQPTQQESKYETDYLLINPAIKGKWVLDKHLNFYGQGGLRTDLLLRHSKNVEYFYNNIIQRDRDLKRFSYGVTLGPGIELPFDWGMLRFEYTRFVDFNNVVYVKGPRLDGFGDAGYYFKEKAHTAMYTACVLVKL